MNITIEAFGETEMNRTLLRFAAAADNFEPAFREIHEDFLEIEKRQFEGQGVGPSGSWAPLAPSTAAAKARLGIDPRILFGETGDLFASLATGGNSDSVYETTPDSMRMGSLVPYGIYHQSRSPRNKLPRRPVVDLSESTKREWMKILQRHLTGAVE